jgi:hypothetical protein
LFEGAELIVLLPYGGGELEGAWLDELPLYGGRVLLTTTELAEELPPYGGGELLDGRSVELLLPSIGGTLPEVDRDGWDTPLLDVDRLCEDLDRLSVEEDMEAEPVGNWLTDVVIPLE